MLILSLCSPSRGLGGGREEAREKALLKGFVFRKVTSPGTRDPNCSRLSCSSFRDPSSWAICCCFSGFTSRELSQKLEQLRLKSVPRWDGCCFLFCFVLNNSFIGIRYWYHKTNPYEVVWFSDFWNNHGCAVIPINSRTWSPLTLNSMPS